MASVVYAVPYLPAPAPATPWPGMGFVWEGWDGSVWDIGSRIGSGVYLRAASGLLAPPSQRFASSSPAVAGSRTTGWRDEEREVRWALTVFHDAGSQAWVDYNRAFFRTMIPNHPGMWTVTHPDGDTRALSCQYISDGEPLIVTDPSRMGWQQYDLTLVAEDPYWRGPLISQPFAAADPLTFVPPGGFPPVRISEGSLASSAAIANPGDVDAWATWWLTDTTSAVVGVGDRVVTVPFAVAGGRLLVIDTSPTQRTAIEVDAPPLLGGVPQSLDAQQAWVGAHLASGTDRTRELGAETKFGPVPPAASADLSVALVGTAAVARATIVPGYYRAW